MRAHSQETASQSKQEPQSHALSQPTRPFVIQAKRDTGSSPGAGEAGVQSPGATQVIQRNGFLAGAGNSWHVHYDHVKYKSDNSSRINTNGRTAKQVLDAMKQNTSWPWHKAGHVQAYKDCKNWVKTNMN